MMNIYNGNQIMDFNGYAEIQMPNWFEALNRDFRYQLTVVDAADSESFVLAKVVREIDGNSFQIRNSLPYTKVSWQVTGVRQDAYAEVNRIPVEVDKPDHERGFFIHPEVYGLSRERNLDAAREALRASIAIEQGQVDSSSADLLPPGVMITVEEDEQLNPQREAEK